MRKRRLGNQYILRVAALFTVLLLVVGCSQPAPSAPPPAPTQAPSAAAPAAAAKPSGNPIRIGAYMPLTGNIAAIGQAAKNGIDLALDNISAKGVLGRPVQLLIEDDQGKPEVGIAAFEKLYTQQGIRLFTAGNGSTTGYATLGAERKYAPNIVHAAPGYATLAVEQEYGKEPWAFFIYPWPYYAAENAGDFLKTLNPAPKAVAIAHEAAEFGTGIAKDVETALNQRGIPVVAREAYDASATDLSPLISKLKAKNPDVLAWIGYLPDSVLLVKQSKELDFNPNLMIQVSATAAQASWMNAAGPQLSEYIIAVTPWVPAVAFPASKDRPDLFPSTKDFVAQFRAKYKDPPDAVALQGYVGMAMFAAAIERAGSDTDLEKIKAELRATDTMTPWGPLKFTPSRIDPQHGFKTQIVTQWQKGELQVVYPQAGATAPLIYPAPAWNKR